MTRLYFTGTGEFDWSIDPNSECYNPSNESNPSVYCFWLDDLANLPPGIPYDIQKVRASLINVLPPDYGQRTVKSEPKVQGPVQSAGATFASDTQRVNREWRLVSGAK
jgi:hypothetical protein